MLNIISRSFVSPYTRGPRKVVINTIAGLEALGIPYVVNHALDATDLLWIHDDPVAFATIPSLPERVRVIAGPNIYTLPSEVPAQVASERFVYLHPAPWVEAFWRAFGGAQLRSVVWPVGVDTERFQPRGARKDTVLVYNKMRDPAEVKLVCDALHAREITYRVLTYGQYTEAEYEALLARAKALVWVGRSESQGMALLEALAADVPILVWDVTQFGQWTGGGKERFTAEQLAWSEVTAVPYFDARCGARFTAAAELPTALDSFLVSLPSYQPRAYVCAQLTLARQAQALLAIYTTHLGASPDSVTDRTLHTTRRWRNASLAFRILTSAKGALRRFLR